MILSTLKFFLLTTSLFLSGLLGAQQVLPNHLAVPDQPFSLKFIWKADSINGKWDKHAAILLPVEINHCPAKLYMQFDLGAPSSVLYSNELNELSTKYPETIFVSDTSTSLYDFSLLVGGVSLNATEIGLLRLKRKAGLTPSNDFHIIGTLGTDLIDNRQVLIDYPGQRIYINYLLDDTLEATRLFYSDRRILLPSSIRGKQTVLYFDTGSSAFELLTSQEMALTLADPDAIPLRYKVNSWERTLEAVSVPTNDSILLAGKTIPLCNATYIEGASQTQVQQMMKLGIGGMTGNKLFLPYRLFLDLRNKKFALLNGDAK